MDGRWLAAWGAVLLVLLPLSGATGESASDDDWQPCYGPAALALPCQLAIHVDLRILACDETNCTVEVQGTALGETTLPGLNQILSTVAGGDGSGLCSSTEAVQRVYDLVAPCKALCSATNVSASASCAGRVTVTVPAPRGGSEGSLWVFTDYTWDSQLAGWGSSTLLFGIRQHADGSVEISVYPH